MTREAIRRFEIGEARLGRRDVALGLGVGGVALSAGAWAIGPINQQPTWVRVGMVVVALLVAPVVILVVIYLVKLVRARLRRVMLYDELWEECERAVDGLDRAQAMLLALANRLGGPVAIERVKYFKNKIYIVLKKKRGFRGKKGSSVVVIDLNDGQPMGRFRIIEADGGKYVAEPDGYVDPVWVGDIHRLGKSEMDGPPGTAAFLVEEDLNADGEE